MMKQPLICITVLASLAVHAQDTSRWPDTYVARLEALALMQTLNAELLASRSATTTLEEWCRTHRLADPAQISARRVTDVNRAPTDEQRKRLDVSSDQVVKYRRVDLHCGTQLLSEADNWYVPSRLTDDMNKLLDTTESPFGRVVASLEPYRRTFAVTVLWSPLPDGWARGAAKPSLSAPTPTTALSIPDALFEHRAVLYTRDNRPFAEVREVYQHQVLGNR